LWHLLFARLLHSPSWRLYSASAIEGLWPVLFNRLSFPSSLKVKFPAAKAVLAMPSSTVVNVNGQMIGRCNILCSKQASFATNSLTDNNIPSQV
jgi:hypothetical protein